MHVYCFCHIVISQICCRVKRGKKRKHDGIPIQNFFNTYLFPLLNFPVQFSYSCTKQTLQIYLNPSLKCIYISILTKKASQFLLSTFQLMNLGCVVELYSILLVSGQLSCWEVSIKINACIYMHKHSLSTLMVYHILLRVSNSQELGSGMSEQDIYIFQWTKLS